MEDCKLFCFINSIIINFIAVNYSPFTNCSQWCHLYNMLYIGEIVRIIWFKYWWTHVANNRTEPRPIIIRLPPTSTLSDNHINLFSHIIREHG